MLSRIQRLPYAGSMNAGTTFFLDGVVNLFILASILIGVFDFPDTIIFTRIIPGAALAIFVGNFLLGWEAQHRSRALGGRPVTAIPIGLDISSTFLIAFLVLGPIYVAQKESLGSDEAARLAWYVGMAITLWIGVGKLCLSVLGRTVQNILPNSAVLGTLAGVAITWMGAEPLLGIFEHPEAGMLSLAIIIFSLMAGYRLPFNLPGAFVAVSLGTLIYMLMTVLNVRPDYVMATPRPTELTLPLLSLGGFEQLFSGGISYLGVALPLTLFAAISAVNIVRSAKLVGDDFSTRRVMVIDGGATLISALSGGVVQTVTYLGHTSYKRMGAQMYYAFGAAVVILFLTCVGWIELAASYIPSAVIKGVLIVVAADIVRISLRAVKAEHAPSFIFAIIPAVLAYAYAKLELFYNEASAGFASLGVVGADYFSETSLREYMLLGVLSRGYILTALLFGAIVCWIVNKQFQRAALAAFICALCSLFGIIHSVLPSGAIYLPWMLSVSVEQMHLLWGFVSAYIILALMLWCLSLTRQPSNTMTALDVTDGGYD